MENPDVLTIKLLNNTSKKQISSHFKCEFSCLRKIIFLNFKQK